MDLTANSAYGTWTRFVKYFPLREARRIGFVSTKLGALLTGAIKRLHLRMNTASSENRTPKLNLLRINHVIKNALSVS